MCLWYAMNIVEFEINFLLVGSCLLLHLQVASKVNRNSDFADLQQPLDYPYRRYLLSVSFKRIGFFCVSISFSLFRLPFEAKNKWKISQFYYSYPKKI